jgi:hypothetical protein
MSLLSIVSLGGISLELENKDVRPMAVTQVTKFMKCMNAIN